MWFLIHLYNISFSNEIEGKYKYSYDSMFILNKITLLPYFCYNSLLKA